VLLSGGGEEGGGGRALFVCHRRNSYSVALRRDVVGGRGDIPGRRGGGVNRQQQWTQVRLETMFLDHSYVFFL